MTEQVLVGDGGKKKKAPRWQFIVILVAALILAAAAGGLLRWFSRDVPDTEQQTLSRLPQSVDDAQELRTSGNTEEATKKIDKALNNPETPAETRYMMYLQKGHIELEANNPKGALEAYQKAADIKQTAEVFIVLGDTYRAQDDKTKAIEAYKKAIPLLPKDSPLSDEDKAYLEQRIKDLGGQP